MAPPTAPAARGVWPRLPRRESHDTIATLHRYCQIVGKTRLALAPMQNHWWQVALYLTARGLTTTPMPYQGRTFEVEFDFVEHRLRARTSDGGARELALAPQTVADFYTSYRDLLRALEISVPIWPVPSEMPDVLRFDRDREHRAYDPAVARACWEALAQADRVIKVFRGRYLGKSSPVHFWWGGFDLACTRFSGRKAPRHPGGIPHLPDRVAREAYSHECISAGWWPGNAEGPLEEAHFYAYVYPEPPGCPTAPVSPAAAGYHLGLHEWTMPYEAVRAAPDPDAMLMEFLESTYGAAAQLGAWNRTEVEREPAG